MTASILPLPQVREGVLSMNSMFYGDLPQANCVSQYQVFGPKSGVSSVMSMILRPPRFYG
jgi:hypothetical protein